MWLDYWRTAYDVWRLQVETMTLVMGAPAVIALRFARAARGGGDVTDREWQRMVTEKLQANAEAQARLARLAMRPVVDAESWARLVKAAPSLVTPYTRRVRSNIKRLS